MKKKGIIIGIIVIVLLALFYFYGIDYLFYSQYNKNGISHLLVVTLDDNQPREYIGTLDNRRIYMEGLNIKETCFRSVDAKNVSVHEVIEKKLVTFDELKHYAWRIIKDGDSLVLKYDNYEIACAYDDCVIKPKS